MNYPDIKLNTKFNRLVLIERLPKEKGKKQIWRLICDCGKEVLARCDNIVNNSVTSCKCYRGEQISKGINKKIKSTLINKNKRYKVEFTAYKSMIRRCTDSSCESYPSYGGRGISVCSRWIDSFDNFILDMGTRPSIKHSLDRIDNDGNYEPSNCRWTLPHIQQRNKRTNKYYSFIGKRMCLVDWAQFFGVKKNTLWCRIHNWGETKAFQVSLEKMEKEIDKVMNS